MSLCLTKRHWLFLISLPLKNQSLIRLGEFVEVPVHQDHPHRDYYHFHSQMTLCPPRAIYFVSHFHTHVRIQLKFQLGSSAIKLFL